MAYNPFAPANGLFRSADNAEMQAGGKPLEDSVANYASYGIVDSMTSGAVGIYNSGASLLNSMGASLDTYTPDAVIKNTWGAEASGFYQRHQMGADIGGMLFGAGVAALGAVKVLRLAQGAGYMTMGAESATGLANADLVMGSKAVSAAKDAAISNPISFAWSNPKTWDAIGLGFKTQMLDALVMDGAIAATNNQNVLLNPDHKDYWSSLYSTTVEFAPWTIAGGLFGGVLTGFQVKGAVKSAWEAKAVENQRFRLIGAELPEHGIAGDKLTVGLQLLNDLIHDPKYAVNAEDRFAVASKAQGIAQVQAYLDKTFIGVNKAGKEGLQAFARELQAVKTTPTALSDVADRVAGLQGLGYINARQAEFLDDFYQKTVSPTFFAIADTVNSAIRAGADFLKQGADPSLHEVIDLAMQESIRFHDTGTAATGGYMVGNSQYYAAMADSLRSIGIQKPTGANYLAYSGEFGGYGVVQKNAFTGTLYDQRLADLTAGVKELSAKVHAATGGKIQLFTDFTAEDMADMVFVHELSHFKTNGQMAVDQLEASLIKGTKLSQEFEQFSRVKYADYWRYFDRKVADLISDGHSPKEARKLALTTDTVYGPSELGVDGYPLKPIEMIAQAAEFILHPEHAETAARIAPNVVKFFNKHGAFKKPFSPTMAYKNVRTGEEMTSVLPLPQDLGKVKMAGDSIHMDKQGLGFKYTTDFYDPALVDTIHVVDKERYMAIHDMPYFRSAAQFAAMAQKKFTELFPRTGGSIIVGKHDLPLMEKLVTDLRNADNAKLLQDSGFKLQLNAGTKDAPHLVDVTAAELESKLIEGKDRMRLAMMNTYSQNEQMIAHALNMSWEQGMGITGLGNTGKILMGERNYDQAEHIVARYTNIKPREIGVQVKSLTALGQRQAMFEEMASRGAAEVIGSEFASLPARELVNGEAQNLAETATRATVVTNVRGNVGKLGLREWAQNVGRIVKEIKGKAGQAIEESFAPWYEAFNRPAAYALRSELALATNKLYEGWYNSVQVVRKTLSANGEEIVAPVYILAGVDTLTSYRAAAANLIKAASEGDSIALEELHNLPNEFPGLTIGDAEDVAVALMQKQELGKDAMQLSTEVGSFFENAVKPFNMEAARKHQIIAGAKGLNSGYRTDVLYPPPRDLKKYPHIAFVVPKAGSPAAGVEKHYMLYAKTAEELQVKMLTAQEKYGEEFFVGTQEQIAQHKQLVGDFNPEDAFDEWFFDPSITRKGRAADASPNLDIAASEVLDRFRNWQHRTSEGQIMSAVELHYNRATAALTSADAQFGLAARASMLGRTTPDTIFKDTLNLMLDKSSKQGQKTELYRKVSGLVSEQGGKVIDSIVNRFGNPASKGFTQEHFDEMNKNLAARGFNPPYQDMMRAVLASPDASASRSFETLVRTANNLVGTFQLRLDVANSILQVISTPILMLPVVREAMMNSQEARNILSVNNPLLKRGEPTPMKLMLRAVTRFFTEDGKTLMAEARGRKILTDYLKEYTEAQDFSSLTGRHSLQAVNDKITQLGKFGGKWSLHRFSEDFSRYLVISAIDDVCKLRGIAGEEKWTVISNSVDAVHGIYRAHQRPQLFNGIIGQAIGMYQTYMFNWMQNAVRYTEQAGAKGHLGRMMLMQGSIFGMRSFPGFETLNTSIANSNEGRVDIYQASKADDPNSWASWVMYGLGSHSFLGSDFSSRGDVVFRNKLVVPTTVQDIPSVSILGNIIANMVKTGDMLANGDTSVGNALLFGLAHNGLSRPLQGLGTAALGQVTSNAGIPLFLDSNHQGYDQANEINYAGIASRLIGTRPIEEAIMLDNYYRQKGYMSAVRADTEEIGTQIRLATAAGRSPSPEDWEGFANQYEKTGAPIEQFNAFASRILASSTAAEVQRFHQMMTDNGPMQRFQNRLQYERKAISPEEQAL